MSRTSNNPVLRRHTLALAAELAGQRTIRYICQGLPDHACGAAQVAYEYGTQALAATPDVDLIAEARHAVRREWTRDEFELAARIAYDNAIADLDREATHD